MFVGFYRFLPDHVEMAGKISPVKINIDKGIGQVYAFWNLKDLSLEKLAKKTQSILFNKDLEWKGNKRSFHVPTKDPYFGIFSASEAKTSLGYSTCLTAIYV